MLKATNLKFVLAKKISFTSGSLYACQCIINGIFLNGFSVWIKDGKFKVILPQWKVSKNKKIPFFFPVSGSFEKAVFEAFKKQRQEVLGQALKIIEKAEKKKGSLTKREKKLIAGKKGLKILMSKKNEPKLIRTVYPIKEKKLL